MSKHEELKIPKGSYAAGRRVTLPQGATQPIVVYINGVAQTEGEDYVEMWQEGQWNDHGPSVEKSCVVCEFDQPQLFTPAGF